MDFDPIEALEAGFIFAVIAAFTWRDGRGLIAYLAAAFSGAGAAIYTIKNGFNSDAGIAWALVLALLVLGCARDLTRTKT
jgi:thiamine transporter ThiT